MGGGYSKIYKAKVLSAEGPYIKVLVDIGAVAASCVGCALAATCGREQGSGSEDTVVLHVGVGKYASPAVGSDVTVGLPKGRTARAAMILLALPLTVFLMTAVVCAVAGVSDGLTAVSALAAASIIYLIIYVANRRKTTPWVLIDKKV